MDRRNRIITYPLTFSLKLYKKVVSPFLFVSFGGACKYQPTCSAYAHDVLQKHGVIKGTILSIYRILRCNPFSKGGYDPA